MLYHAKRTNEQTGRNGETRQNLKGTAICKLDKGGACKFHPGAQATPLAHPAAAKLATELLRAKTVVSASAEGLKDFPVKRHAYIRRCAMLLHTF